MKWLTEDMVLDGIDAIYNPPAQKRLRIGKPGLLQDFLKGARETTPTTRTQRKVVNGS